MDVLSAPPRADTIVRSEPGAGVAIRFDVIKARAATVLEIHPREVTYDRLAELFGVSVRTIGRWAAGSGALLETVTEIGIKLGLPIEDFTGTPVVGGESA